jgi:multidrug efflux pump subunit AcrB
VIFAPLLGVFILSPPKSTEQKEGSFLRVYRGLLTGAIRARWLTIPLTLALFVGSIFAIPMVPNQFFPSSDRPELLVDLTLPQNASIHATKTMAENFDAVLKGDPDVKRWSTYVGQGAIRFYLPLDVQLPSDFFGQAVVVAKDVAARERLKVKLEKVLASEFPTVVARVYPLELGPPVGWPVQYRVSGPDLAQVRGIALKLAQVVANDPRAHNVNFDWIEPAREVRIQIDQDQARLLGLSSDALASVLNTVISGISISQVRDDIYLVDVVVRSADEERASLATLRQLPVPLPNGRTVPLSQFASFEYTQSTPVVWRRDRIPTLTVQADVAPGVLPETVVSSLASEVDTLSKSLPSSYSIAVGGTVEESKKSQASVMAVVPLMLLIMITVLMFQLQSFSRLFLALSVAPLGLIGVVGALLLSGRPLGFVAILGILALLGMITKNAVILIGQIDAEREQGKNVVQAAIDASSARLRPIVLTAISTVLGMIPIAPTVFWGPMAVSIMGGLLVATLLTLIFLPTAYVALFGGTSKAQPTPAKAEG